ncbi:MAG TPA: homoserine O-acetyltransferase [Gemmatimonadales bacterium]|nr:homoserine O-acetyltransferase [Gemmatimonadales bacterium]
MTGTLVPRSEVMDLELGTLDLERGGRLDGARLRYRILGDPTAGDVNGWALVFHALTGSADVDAWWGPLVGDGRALDTTRTPVLAANLLGSCYGSTAPRVWEAEHGQRFPELTTLDLARAHIPLVEQLGIRRIAVASGGSLGGMVALQWGRVSPVPVGRLVVFAAPAATSAQAIAWNAAQRMAIEADPRWRGGRYSPGDGPDAGLAAARALAMITYRSAVEFDQRFGRGAGRQPGRFDADHYLRRQGEKLVARFDAASYVSLMQSMDLHNVGDLPAAAAATASRVGDVVGVGIDTDILYYPREVRAWVEAYRAAGANARYEEIRSIYGHDAFLIEFEQVSRILALD